jgi:hypothetical protein
LACGTEKYHYFNKGPKMKSWWDLGEGVGYSGSDLALHNITCPFCEERGNFSTAFHAEKKKPNGSKKLNFDTLKCGNCAGYVMVLWSGESFGVGSRGIHDFRLIPWPIKISEYPKDWPETVGRFWMQTHRSLKDENWDAAAVMARSSLQAALREQGAKGSSLKKEIEDLAQKGILPRIIVDWSDEVRELGNDSAHPSPDQSPTDPKDAKDIVGFLDFLLEYLYDLPYRIEVYRGRKDKGSAT